VIIGINGYSNIAGVIAGQLFKAQYAPRYRYPLKVTMILMAVGMVGFGAIRAVYMWENKRRMDRMRTGMRVRSVLSRGVKMGGEVIRGGLLSTVTKRVCEIKKAWRGSYRG
jgi:hypothetical protein